MMTTNFTQNRAEEIFVLHGSYAIVGGEQLFFFWAETTVRRRSRKEGVHPFSCTAIETRKLLSTLGLHSGSKIRDLKVDGHFPSSPVGPVPSGEMEGLISAYEGEDNPDISMKEWQIAGVGMEMYEAFESILCAHFQGSILMGKDLKFWQSASTFAFNLMMDMKFIPSVSDDGAALKSRWIPILETAEDQNLFNNIFRSMPGSCLAFIYGKMNEETLLRNFFATVIDMTSRKLLASSVPGIDTRHASDVMLWALSLSGENSTFSYNRSLSIQKISGWARRIQSTSEFPMRLAFNLLPPADDDEEWVLKFMLQSKNDPSLIVPVEEVWKDHRSAANAMIRKFTEYPEEFLLQAIGTAQAVYPPIRKSLMAPAPSQLTLHSEEVYDLLNNYSVSLSSAGFGVLFPDWWGRNKVRLGLKVTAKPSPNVGMGKVGLQALVSYNLEIVLDGEVISKSDLDKLSRLKSPLVQIGKKWVEVDKERLTRILKLLRKREGEVPLVELLSMGTDQDSIPVVDLHGEGWVGDLIEGKSRVSEIPVPAGFKGSLREYQKHGVSWIKFMVDMGLGCCLADDMGLGKTIQILAFLQHRKKTGQGGVTLVVCPTSVISNWMHEIKRFTPRLKFLVHHGTMRAKENEFINVVPEYDLVLTSYSLLTKDQDFLSKVRWDGIVADEAQAVKNYSTKQSKALRSLQAEFRIAMTGTPIENRLDDLRSIFEFINPGYLGSENSFRQRFTLPIEREKSDEASSKLNRLVNPFILRRVKTDQKIISDLPQKNEMKVFVPITKEQATLYQASVESMISSLKDSEGIAKKGIILASITKLKRLLDHPSLVSGDLDTRIERSQKMVRLLEMLNEILEDNEKVLIFTQYVETGKIIKENVMKRLNREAMFLSGSTPRGIREQMVQRFQEPGGPMVFIISVKAGGFGINLTAASNVIHFDRWWNPSVEDQATDRAYRIGQSKNVNVYKFVSTGTIEEKIDEIIEGKSTLRNKIVAASDESWITSLSGSDLKEVFSLRKDQVWEDDQ